MAKAMVVVVRGIEGKVETVTAESRLEVGIGVLAVSEMAGRETRTRVRAGLRATYTRNEWRWPEPQANVSVPTSGTSVDLAIAVALLVMDERIPQDWADRMVFYGEVGLDGSVRPVTGALIAAEAAMRAGKTLVVAPESAPEVLFAWPPGETPRVLFVDCLADLMTPAERHISLPERAPRRGPAPFNMDQIRGQDRAKRAAEIAMAGRHNLLLVGPPGCGKTLLARAAIGLLPEMTRGEALESARISSVTGLGRMAGRPFRAPHMTASEAALVGGGSPASPGEVSLAHNGVLFLDEVCEFRRSALEAVARVMDRKPAEVARMTSTTVYPADFVLIMATNPCPCGHAGDPRRQCRCSPEQVANYVARLAPVLRPGTLRVRMHSDYTVSDAVAPFPAYPVDPQARDSVAKTIAKLAGRDRVNGADLAEAESFLS